MIARERAAHLKRILTELAWMQPMAKVDGDLFLAHLLEMAMSECEQHLLQTVELKVIAGKLPDEGEAR